MKFLLCMFLMTLSFIAMANNESDAMSALGVGTPSPSITNLSAPATQVAPARAVASESIPAIDPEKAKEIMEALSKHQKTMEAQSKMLEEMEFEEE